MADLLWVDWPTKFPPDLPGKYDGTIDPEEFLQIYTNAIQAVGGGPRVLANYFHVSLWEIARSWLMNLLPGSVGSWGSYVSSSSPTSPGRSLDEERTATSSLSNNARANCCRSTCSISARFVIPFPAFL
jgi:hypothetical protein